MSSYFEKYYGTSHHPSLSTRVPDSPELLGRSSSPVPASSIITLDDGDADYQRQRLPSPNYSTRLSHSTSIYPTRASSTAPTCDLRLESAEGYGVAPPESRSTVRRAPKVSNRTSTRSSIHDYPASSYDHTTTSLTSHSSHYDGEHTATTITSDRPIPSNEGVASPVRSKISTSSITTCSSSVLTHKEAERSQAVYEHAQHARMASASSHQLFFYAPSPVVPASGGHSAIVIPTMTGPLSSGLAVSTRDDEHRLHQPGVPTAPVQARAQASMTSIALGVGLDSHTDSPRLAQVLARLPWAEPPHRTVSPGKSTFAHPIGSTSTGPINTAHQAYPFLTSDPQPSYAHYPYTPSRSSSRASFVTDTSTTARRVPPSPLVIPPRREVGAQPDRHYSYTTGDILSSSSGMAEAGSSRRRDMPSPDIQPVPDYSTYGAGPLRDTNESRPNTRFSFRRFGSTASSKSGRSVLTASIKSRGSKRSRASTIKTLKSQRGSESTLHAYGGRRWEVLPLALQGVLLGEVVRGNTGEGMRGGVDGVGEGPRGVAEHELDFDALVSRAVVLERLLRLGKRVSVLPYRLGGT
jgi:hypothetical protein